MKKYNYILFVTALSLLLIGCSSDNAVNQPDASSVKPIDQSTWVVTALTTVEGNRRAALYFPSYRMRFDGNTALGNFTLGFSNCGGLYGNSELSDGNVITTTGVDARAGDCAGVSSGNPETDTFLTDVFLNTRNTYSVDGNHLTVMSPSGRAIEFISTLAHKEGEPDSELALHPWGLRQVETSNGEVIMEDRVFDQKPRFSIGVLKAIDASGGVQQYIGGESLCVSFFANYTLESNVLSLSNTETDLAQCEFSDTEIPAAFQSVLLTENAVAMIEIEDEKLTIISADNVRLVFEPFVFEYF